MPMPRFTRSGLAVVMLAVLALAATPPAEATKKRRPDNTATAAYGPREDVMRFATEAAERQQLDPAWAQAALAEARYVPRVAQLIMPAPVPTARNWAAYHDRFVEPVRIRAGVAFWNANEAWLRLAEERYGVPPEIVVGIVGVETLYGRHMGSFRVLDALATLSFDFPAGRSDRSEFFRQELESFLVLCRREGLAPGSVLGSYAGAIGMPQFMPSSVNRMAVDFDGDGHIDLHDSTADVIGSVAHYLAEHGWQRGMPTHYEVTPPQDMAQRAVLLGPDILPSFDAAQFTAHGALLSPAGLEHEGKLALVEVFNGDAPPSYVAGTANFYAATRYNWSSYYALAVIALGDAVRLAR